MEGEIIRGREGAEGKRKESKNKLTNQMRE